MRRLLLLSRALSAAAAAAAAEKGHVTRPGSYGVTLRLWLLLL